MSFTNSIRQLFRKPVFLIAFTVLLALSCAFLCVCFGLWENTRQTLREAEETFTTVAVLDDAAFEGAKEGREKREAVRAAGAASAHVRLADHRKSLSGTSERVYSVWPPTAAERNSEVGNEAAPYSSGMLVGTCTRMEEPTSTQFRGGGPPSR